MRMNLHSYVVHAPAKINIGLYVCGKRDDGYHDIETILYPVFHLSDTLRIRVLKTRGKSLFRLIERGPIFTSLPAERNLITRTYELLRPFIPYSHHLTVELWKRIPIGAGLGGWIFGCRRLPSCPNQPVSPASVTGTTPSNCCRTG